MIKKIFLGILIVLSSTFNLANAQEQENPSENISSLELTSVLKDKENAIVKIQILNSLNQEKLSVGSGTILNKNGLISTNYHVISSYFFNPANTQIVFSLGQSEETIRASLEAVDIVNDLALIKPVEKKTFDKVINISDKALIQGEKIYSFGFPHNWNFTVIEEIFNGYMPNKLIPKYLVSNALSAGMSGPALNKDGNLVAINVSATTKLSQLIPVSELEKLIIKYEKSKKKNKYNKTSYTSVKNQAIEGYIEFSDNLIEEFLNNKSINIGKFNIPIKNSFMECWTDSDTDSKKKLADINTDIKEQDRNILMCSSTDNIFLSSNNNIGDIFMKNYYYTSSSPYVLSKLLEKNFNIFATKTQNNMENNCFIHNGTNHNKKLQKTQICISKNNTLDTLFDLVIIQLLHDQLKEGILVFYRFNAISEQSIPKLIKFIKTT